MKYTIWILMVLLSAVLAFGLERLIGLPVLLTGPVFGLTASSLADKVTAGYNAGP